MLSQQKLDYAIHQDSTDPLKAYREQFNLPNSQSAQNIIYFCGNSLGLQPKSVQSYANEIIEMWSNQGVESWFDENNPWIAYTDSIKYSMSRIVGALPSEIAIANTLSINLHLLLVSFYAPTKDRYKIIIEKDAFPSDKYIVHSHLKWHGNDPAEAIIEINSSEGNALEDQDIINSINLHGSETSVILLGGTNYITGQVLDIHEITKTGHAKGCMVGFDLAHSAGNISLDLHNDEVDFAAWCNYKYLNGGPGCIGSLFVHEKHHDKKLNRLEGWWGNKRSNRFMMNDSFDPECGAEAWVTSTPPLLSIAPLKASMEIFDQIDFGMLTQKSEALTTFLQSLIEEINTGAIQIITPLNGRGCQLSLKIDGADKSLCDNMIDNGMICDWREPNILRISPVPLYNSFTEIYFFVKKLDQIIKQKGL